MWSLYWLSQRSLHIFNQCSCFWSRLCPSVPMYRHKNSFLQKMLCYTNYARTSDWSRIHKRTIIWKLSVKVIINFHFQQYNNILYFIYFAVFVIVMDIMLSRSNRSYLSNGQIISYCSYISFILWQVL